MRPINQLLLILAFACFGATRAAVLLSQAPPTGADVDQAFQQLQQGFQSKTTASLGPESFSHAPAASAWLSKAFIARSAADVFNRSNVRMHAEIDRQGLPDPPTQVLRTGAMDCSPKRGCRSDCDGDCRRSLPFGGSFTDPICFAGCEAEKFACETLKTSEKVACEGVKAAFAEKKVGEIRLSGLSAQGRGEVRDLRLSVAPDLARAQLAGTLGASVELRGSLQFTPEPLVQVGTGCIQISGQVPGVQVSAPDQPFSLDATLGLRGTPQGVSLDVSFAALQPEVKITGNPFVDFVLKNPLNFLQCTFPSLIGLAVDSFHGDFPIDEKIQIPGGKPVPVGAIALLDGLTLRPQLTATALGLVAEDPQIPAAGESRPTTTGGGNLP